MGGTATRKTALVLIGTAAGALVLAGCGSSAGSGPEAATSTPSQGCDVTVELVKLHGAAAGTSYWNLVVTGKAACTLPAAPRLTVLGPDKKPLPIKADDDPTAQPFPLAAGASAALVIGYGTDGAGPCDAETTSLQVTPPGSDLAFRAGAKHCANDVLTVGTWVAGTHADPR